jgi:hypothetical protein
MSIFFKYLPYWEDLTVRHAIDGMHLQKNVFESTMGFLGLTGKVKDGLKSRKDLVDLKIRQELHPQPCPNGKQYLSPASYNLTQHERLSICKCLCGLKVPTGFSSNIRSLVSLKDMMLTGCNSHDCHVMITVFLAIAIRAVKPVFLKIVITRMCYSLLGIRPWPTPIYSCKMIVLVASGISCIEVWWSTNGCNWNDAIA